MSSRLLNEPRLLPSSLSQEIGSSPEPDCPPSTSPSVAPTSEALLGLESPHSAFDASSMSQAALPEDSARVDFRNAFITEIDEDLSQKISFRELVDVIVCAGRDVTPEQLKVYWPYESLNS